MTTEQRLRANEKARQTREANRVAKLATPVRQAEGVDGTGTVILDNKKRGKKQITKSESEMEDSNYTCKQS